MKRLSASITWQYNLADMLLGNFKIALIHRPVTRLFNIRTMIYQHNITSSRVIDMEAIPSLILQAIKLLFVRYVYLEVILIAAHRVYACFTSVLVFVANNLDLYDCLVTYTTVFCRQLIVIDCYVLIAGNCIYIFVMVEHFSLEELRVMVELCRSCRTSPSTQHRINSNSKRVLIDDK